MQEEEAPARPPVSRRAIAAVLTGLLPVPVGVFVGWSALQRIRWEEERGRLLAIAGILLSIVSFVGWVIVPGLHEAEPDGKKDLVRMPVAMRAGDCYDYGGSIDPQSSELRRKECSLPHDGEVIGEFSVAATSYPGRSAIDRQAEDACWEQSLDYALDSWALPDTIQITWIVPLEVGWARGQRTVTCMYEDPEGKLTTTLRRDRATLNADQLHYLIAVRGENTVGWEEPEEEVSAATLDEYRSWAADMSTAEAQFIKALDDYAWPAEARPHIAELQREARLAAAAWRKAAKATDADVFAVHHAIAAQNAGYTPGQAVRRILGLALDAKAV